MAREHDTQLEARTKYDVNLLWDKLRRQVEPWRMGFDAHFPFTAVRFDGREIRFQGVRYEGSPEAVLWGGYIEPYLRDGIVRVLESTLERAQSSNSGARPCLIEAGTMLRHLIAETYRMMAEVDYALRTRGHQLMANPPLIQRRDVSDYVNRMNQFLDGQLTATIAQAGPRHSIERVTAWIYDHKLFGCVVVVAVVIVAVGHWVFDLLDLAHKVRAYLSGPSS